VLCAAPALAKKHKKPKGLGPVVTATAVGPTIAAPGISSASASCPSGLQAVGGGFSASFDATNRLVVTESYRSSVNTWHVSAFVGSGSGAATAYAYCRRNNKVITDATATGTVRAAPFKTEAPVFFARGRGCAQRWIQITSGPGPSSIAPMEASAAARCRRSSPVGVTVVARTTTPPQTSPHMSAARLASLPAFRQAQARAAVPQLGPHPDLELPASPKAEEEGQEKEEEVSAAALRRRFLQPVHPGQLDGLPGPYGQSDRRDRLHRQSGERRLRDRDADRAESGDVLLSVT
jgi:hypothetical protein